MSLKASSDEVVICPNCRATNHPNAVVCSGCGVRLDTYRVVNEEWQARKKRDQEERLEQIQAEAQDSVREAAVQGRKNLVRNLVYVTAAFIVLAGLVLATAAVIRAIEAAKLVPMEAAYKKAQECEKAKDLVCARDTLIDLYKESPNFKNTHEYLLNIHLELADQYFSNGQTALGLQELEAALELKKGETALLNRIFETRKLLASQYANSNRWEDSLAELDKALEIRPGDTQVLEQIRNTYDRWYRDALSKGNIILALKIKNQINARFPNE